MYMGIDGESREIVPEPAIIRGGDNAALNGLSQDDRR